MHEVSLVISTLGERPEDLCSLLRTLIPQAESLCDVVVVDQNLDPQLIPALLAEFEGALPIRCTRSERGLSRARNHGLRLTSGKLVAFPDDDCLYTEGLLKWVANWFDANAKYDILAVGVKDAAGVPSGNRWLQDRCDIRPINAFRTTFSSSLFIRREVAMSQQFDVQLGVGSGTPYGSGEETDYVLRLIDAGARGRLDRSRNIIHPRRDMLSGSGSTSRAWSYGFGMGHLLRIHFLSGLCAGFVTYNLARAGWALGRGNRDSADLCFAQTKGIWKGYREPVRVASADRAAALRTNHAAAMQPHQSSTQRGVVPISS